MMEHWTQNDGVINSCPPLSTTQLFKKYILTKVFFPSAFLRFFLSTEPLRQLELLELLQRDTSSSW